MDRTVVSRRRVLALAGAMAAGAGCAAAPGGDGEPTAAGTARTIESDPAADAGTPATASDEGSVYTRVYGETIDSVVLVQVLDDESSGQGSGWVYDDSHVVTNQHVVGDAGEVDVQFHDGGWRVGTVVGTDVYADLAVVRVSELPERATPLPVLESDPAIGERVVAIGNPYGLSGSVSAGIVSGIDRSLTGLTSFPIPDAIQTDAAVNPGNSGGPLVTLDGDVVGVIDAGGGENIAFAISAPLVRRVVPALVEAGEYHHPYLGVTLQGVTSSVARANDLEEAFGVVVDRVLPDGPSADVLEGSDRYERVDGLEVPVGGDVIVRMGDREIPGDQALSSYLALETSPGQSVPVTVVRDGERTTVEVTLGERPPPGSLS